MNNLEKLINRSGDEDVFAAKVQAFLRQKPKFTDGSTTDVHTMRGYPGLVIKRIKDKIRNAPNSAAENASKRVIAEHQVTTSYLARFVPQTAIVQIDLGEGLEWVFVQDKVEGKPLYEFMVDKVAYDVSPKLREELEAFFDSYRQMRNSGMLIEDQLMISFENSTVNVYDTNNLKSPLIARDLYILEGLFGTKSKSLEAEDVWEFLKSGLSLDMNLNFQNEEEYFAQLGASGFIASLYKKFGEKFSDEQVSGVEHLVVEAIQNVVFSLRDFPPKHFRDNDLTLRIRKRLGLK